MNGVDSFGMASPGWALHCCDFRSSGMSFFPVAEELAVRITKKFNKRLASSPIVYHNSIMDSPEIRRSVTASYGRPQESLVGSEPVQGPKTEQIQQAPYGGQPATGAEGQTPSLPSEESYQTRPTRAMYRTLGRGLTNSVQESFTESLRKGQQELDPHGTSPEISRSNRQDSLTNSQNI